MILSENRFPLFGIMPKIRVSDTEHGTPLQAAPRAPAKHQALAHLKIRPNLFQLSAFCSGTGSCSGSASGPGSSGTCTSGITASAFGLRGLLAADAARAGT